MRLFGRCVLGGVETVRKLKGEDFREYVSMAFGANLSGDRTISSVPPALR